MRYVKKKCSCFLFLIYTYCNLLKDYYAILQLSRDASLNEIKKSYRKLALQYHPDVNPSQESNNTFLLITEAYDILSDEQNKNKYDLLLMYGINAEIKTSSKQEENIHPKYKEDGGRKYGTAYKYKNYTNNYNNQKKEEEASSDLIEKILFISLMILGIIAIIFATIDLFTIKIEGLQNFSGLLFGVLFTALLFFYYFFVFKDDKK